MTENEVFEGIHKDCGSLEICNYKKTGYGDCIIRQTLIKAEEALEEIQQYRAIGTVEHIKLTFELCNGLDCMVKMYEAIGTTEEFKALKEKNNKDFELLLKAVKESYPIFKGSYVELDVFMGDVMRRFTRDRKH